MTDLFVYGTLLFPEVLRKITGENFRTVPVLLKDFKRCRLKGLDYPAIIKQQRAEVTGLLLKNVSEKHLHLFSEFEGDEYKIKNVIVYSASKKLPAVTFVWNGDEAILLEEDWDVNTFKEKYLGLYID